MKQSSAPVAAPADGGAGADVEGTLAEQLFRRLTDAILQGELPLGSKISEPILAQRYGVSRGPLREALHRLQERHLITRSANHGARVVEATPERLAAIFAVREVLEGLAAREAAHLMQEAEIDELREVVARHEAAIAGLQPGDPYTLNAADQDFHFRIAKASGNPIVVRLLCDEFYPLLRLYRSRRVTLADRKRPVIEHQRILAAIEDRDGELAELMMRRHVASAGRRRRDALTADAAIERPGTSA